jgi:hypothetical protein
MSKVWRNARVARMTAGTSLLLASTMANAQSSGMASSMVNGICGMVRPFVGQNSQFLSLIFLISLGVMAFLWFLNENKEGVVIWLLRTGMVLGILINIFTLPQLLGLPSIC